MKEKKINVKSRLKSFKYAINGLITLFKEETNAKVHLASTVLVIIVGIYLKVSSRDWIALTLCIAFVVSMELINTAVEQLADIVSPTWHPLVKKAKDVAAAAVLVAALASVIVGLLVFLPRI